MVTTLDKGGRGNRREGARIPGAVTTALMQKNTTTTTTTPNDHKQDQACGFLQQIERQLHVDVAVFYIFRIAYCSFGVSRIVSVRVRKCGYSHLSATNFFGNANLRLKK
jgi:hypothetical protein